MTTAFYIITRCPDRATKRLADSLVGQVDVVGVAYDEPSDDMPERARAVQLDTPACVATGFVGTNWPMQAKTAISWDMAMLEAFRGGYDHVWFCEDDVAFCGHDTAARMIAATRDDDTDFLCVEFNRAQEGDAWPNWRFGHPDHHKKAWAFMPLCRMSRALLEEIDATARRDGTLTFMEVMVASLAVDAGLKTGLIGPAGNRFFRYRPFVDWFDIGFADVNGLIVHPVKDPTLRERLMFGAPLGWRERALSLIASIPFRMRRRLQGYAENFRKGYAEWRASRG